MNVRAASGAFSVVAALLVSGQMAPANPSGSAAAAQTEGAAPSAATRCSGVHGFASQPVPVAKTADGSEELASVQ